MDVKKSCQYFINHRGTYDPWPIIAYTVRPDRYGPTGNFGFGQGAHVNDFTFNNNHETCTKPSHIESFVIPVVNGVKPIYDCNSEYPFDINICNYIKWGFYISIICCICISILMYHNGFAFFSMIPVIIPIIYIIFSLWFYLKDRISQLQNNTDC